MFGFVQQETSVWCHMVCNVVLDVFWGTLLRPSHCGRCSVDPKIHHPAKCSLTMREHTGGSLGNCVLVFHRDICREHNLIGRCNYPMSEAATSPSVAAGLELSKTKNAIANLASGWATAGFASVRVCVLWRPRASVGRAQAER